MHVSGWGRIFFSAVEGSYSYMDRAKRTQTYFFGMIETTPSKKVGGALSSLGWWIYAIGYFMQKPVY